MASETLKQQILAAKAAKQYTWDDTAARLGMSITPGMGRKSDPARVLETILPQVDRLSFVG
ncbi:MAG: hypothetical protein L0Y39_10885 [Methylococcaceae bacterium]|nr:hypothetical protein [Methylococcaceae bacterium]